MGCSRARGSKSIPADLRRTDPSRRDVATFTLRQEPKRLLRGDAVDRALDTTCARRLQAQGAVRRRSARPLTQKTLSR
jgi:hypothetical protein